MPNTISRSPAGAVPTLETPAAAEVAQAQRPAGAVAVDAAVRDVAAFRPARPLRPAAAVSVLAPQDLGRLRGAALYDGIGEMNADWARLRVFAYVMLEVSGGSRVSRNVNVLRPQFVAALAAYGLQADEAQVNGLIDRMVQVGMLNREGDQLSLGADARVIATRSHAQGFIHGEISRALAQLEGDPLGGDALRGLLLDYARAVANWPLDPIEANGGLLKAVNQLTVEEKRALVAFIDSEEELLNSPAIDAVRLNLAPRDVRSDWMERNAPNLRGRTLYMVTPEDSMVVGGGLGRVNRYHENRIQRLLNQGGQTLPQKAELATVSPRYDFRFSATGQATPLDYGALSDGPGPVRELSQYRQYDDIDLEDRGIHSATVQVGKTDEGIKRVLISDSSSDNTKALYQYGRSATDAAGQRVTQGDWEDFTDLFGSAAAGAIRDMTLEDRQAKGEAFRGPLVWGNDAQSSLAISYLANAQALEQSAVDNIKLTATTHTINNRGSGQGVNEWNLPQMLRARADRLGVADPTSMMLRSASATASGGRPLVNAVSSVHAAEVRAIDPGVDILAITNGTQVDEFRQAFIDVLPEAQRPASLDAITADQLAQARRIAKEQLAAELGVPAAEIPAFANQMLVSYSGRMVDEKAGAKANQLFNDVSLDPNDSTTERNIEGMLKAGINVVVYGNVQASAESAELFARFTALQRRYDAQRPQWAATATAANREQPGRLIMRTGWGPEEQQRLGRATDLQAQISDRVPLWWSGGRPIGTEANGFTEAPVFAYGGLQMGPPDLHGGLNTMGSLVNWSDAAQGNTVVPNQYSARGFLDAVLRAKDEYTNRPQQFAQRRVTSFRAAPVIDAINPAAEYLRMFNRFFES